MISVNIKNKELTDNLYHDEKKFIENFDHDFLDCASGDELLGERYHVLAG